jgi:AraC-like DNA-binding protein
MDSGSAGHLHFDTGALPAHDRFPAFCEEIIRRYTGLDVKTDDPSGFHGSVDFWKAGDVKIGRNISSSIGSARTRGLLRDGDDDLLVNLLVTGRAVQTQRAEEQELGPGDAIVCDCAYPGELNFFTDVEFWNLKIPRALIANSLPHSGNLAGLKLNADATARRLLFEYITVASAAGLRGEGAAVHLVGQHIVDLVVLALGAEGDVRRFANQHGARAARRGAIIREIARRSADPALSAATVASQFGVTPRYVHLLLEETGKSFTHHVLERRLDNAAAMLRDPELRHCKIAAIAAEAGFTDLSYFNRAFRRYFGATPSDIREHVKFRG